MRGGEQVQVIGHQEVETDQPGSSFPPRSKKQFMNLWLRNPGKAVLSVHRNEHDGGLAQITVNARGGLVSAWFLAPWIHAAMVLAEGA